MYLQYGFWTLGELKIKREREKIIEISVSEKKGKKKINIFIKKQLQDAQC